MIHTKEETCDYTSCTQLKQTRELVTFIVRLLVLLLFLLLFVRFFQLLMSLNFNFLEKDYHRFILQITMLVVISSQLSI